jgi:hypothetical protein
VFERREEVTSARIRKVAAVARLMLSGQAISALEEMETKWVKAEDEESSYERLDSRLFAIRNARRLVAEAAKRDLKV